MAETTINQGLRKLVQARINKDVSESLGTLSRDLNELPKGMSDDERAELRLELLSMIEEGTKVFFKKMKSRIETARIESE